MQLEHLKELDLSEGQIKVYRAVLELGNTGVNRIQEKTGIERRNIYDILNKLIEKGMITYTVESGKRTYQCTHPNTLHEKIKEKQAALKQLQSELPDIKELFNATRPDIRAEVLRGNEAIKAFLNEALDHEATYWIGGNSGVEASTGKGMNLWFKNWMERKKEAGRMMYDLVDHGTFLEDFPPENIKKHKEYLYKYRQLPKDLQSPMVMIMYGNKVAQVLWAEQSFAFVLESEEIHESFMKYFNYFWKDPW